MHVLTFSEGLEPHNETNVGHGGKHPTNLYLYLFTFVSFALKPLYPLIYFIGSRLDPKAGVDMEGRGRKAHDLVVNQILDSRNSRFQGLFYFTCLRYLFFDAVSLR
jgi:hypothetical protein